MFYLNNYKTHLCGKRWNSCVTHLRLNSPKPNFGKIYIKYFNSKHIHILRTEECKPQKIISPHHTSYLPWQRFFSPAVKSMWAPNSLIIFKVEVVSHLVKLSFYFEKCIELRWKMQNLRNWQFEILTRIQYLRKSKMCARKEICVHACHQSIFYLYI